MLSTDKDYCMDYLCLSTLLHILVIHRQRDTDVTIYDHTPNAEEDPYADSGIYEAVVHKIKVQLSVCPSVCLYAVCVYTM